MIGPLDVNGIDVVVGDTTAQSADRVFTIVVVGGLDLSDAVLFVYVKTRETVRTVCGCLRFRNLDIGAVDELVQLDRDGANADFVFIEDSVVIVVFVNVS